MVITTSSFFVTKKIATKNTNKFIKILYWNAFGVLNKDYTFFKFIEQYEIICLSETWVLEKDEKKIRIKLSKNCNWYFMSAEKGGKRGRAKGGVIIGVKNNLNANIHIVEKWFAKITLKTNNKKLQYIFRLSDRK